MVALSEIQGPSDLRALSLEECVVLADDIRTKIIHTVSHNGGHLSSNLGMVEITMALHRVFHSPQDKLVFDVGHQAYAHKLLTGRYECFDSIRTFGGLSGFPKCGESEHDCFETGHASTALSAALGLARARDELKQDHHVVAVVGDGALTGGMCYEALNDCGNDKEKTRLIILLNDNEMSIARNVGGLSNHLSKLRASAGWNITKRKVKTGLQKLPGIGAPLETILHSVKKSLKSFFVDEGFFHALGLRYLGPIDGHDLRTLEKILEQAKLYEEPVVIHCVTKKGYGYYSAERKPEKFHGTPPFFIDNGETPKSDAVANGRVAVDALIELARKDPRITVVTAAMPMGTCTEHFERAYPKRFFDVGIAEEHAVTLCAGMARGGLLPYFFVYSTFLQRGYDQVLHDCCMQNLPVKFLLDRSGLGNEDGESHQGLFDFAYLRHIPRMTLLAPADQAELAQMVRAVHELPGPCAIRYPKNAIVLEGAENRAPFALGHWQTLRPGKDAALLAVGSMAQSALKVADALAEQGVQVEVINASTVKPLDEDCLIRLHARQFPVFTLEEHAILGGFGSAVLERYAKLGLMQRVILLGVEDAFVPHGDHRSLLGLVELDEASLARRLLEKLRSLEAGAAGGGAHG